MNEVSQTLDAVFDAAYVLHDESQRVATTAVVLAARAGAEFMKAKALCRHGEFEARIERDARVSLRSSQLYMQLARGYPELLEPKAQPVAPLPGIRHAIAMLSADDEVKTEVQARLEAGETVSVREIEALKREAQLERETRQQLSAKLDQVQKQNQVLHDNLAAASEREQRTYRELQANEANIAALADEKSQAAIEAARREAEAAQQRVDELREELAHRERQKTFAIREGIQNGLAARQTEVDGLNRAIQQAEAELTDYRQRLKERTGADHENQRLHIDAEKALRELMVLGATLNLFECPAIYSVNWELLDRLVQVTEAIVPRILDFKADHRLAEKPVPPEA
jgi:hypothetical protein